MHPSAIVVGIVAAVVVILLIVKLARRHSDDNTANIVVAPEPPNRTYNDNVVFEAEEIGHGVYEIDFWGDVDDGTVNNFPESLAYFIQQHPTLRVIAVCAGREDTYGVTESMIVLTEPRSTT